MIFILMYIYMIIMVLISVAYLTLVERKVLSYIQLRKGPNKVGYMGLLQPFSDGMKLFFKEQVNLKKYNFIIYQLSPMLMFCASLLLWLVYPYIWVNINFEYSLLFFICCSSLTVYGLLLSGWSSNSMYALLGAFRGVAQVISYEISMMMIMFCFMIFTFSVKLSNFMYFQFYMWFLFFSFPLFICWLCSCLAEVNRAPFDFSEGESEIVSGFNIEYGGVGFAFIFLAEYGNILFMSLITCLLFLGGDLYNFLFYLKFIFLCFWFIWIRATLPRFRYDELMYMTWKSFLPLSLSYFIFFLGFIFVMYMSM
uniref:NADH-ubiquinone oxidoreductase chain 1 n=1 Tax=Haedus sp. TaxID=2931292 RepID=A0A8T9ZZ71_9HEMI|nr:NADH dehydrogenase subunit 1 [Haedus sp.]